MAIRIYSADSGLTLYYLIQSQADKIWNGHVFEVADFSNWLNYIHYFTEDSPPGTYIATFPSGVPAGTYELVGFVQAGATPSAYTDQVTYAGEINWNGTSENNGGGGGGPDLEITFFSGVSEIAPVSIVSGSRAGEGNVSIVGGVR